MTIIKVSVINRNNGSIVKEYAVSCLSLHADPITWATQRIRQIDKAAKDRNDQPIIPDECLLLATPMEFKDNIEEL